MTNPEHTHQAIISAADAPPRPACDGSGRLVANSADVTCPDCMALAADRKARTEVHDTHAIPANDESADHAAYIDAVARALVCAGLTLAEYEVLDDEYREAWIKLAPIDDHTNPMLTWHELEGWRHGWSDPEQLERGIQCLSYLELDHLVTHPAAVAAAVLAFYRPVPDDVDEALTALGDPYPAAEPAKTHDLSIRREFGNVVVGAKEGEDDRVVYLQEGVAQDLGRVLDALTPAQIALLVGDLMGGGK